MNMFFSLLATFSKILFPVTALYLIHLGCCEELPELREIDFILPFSSPTEGSGSVEMQCRFKFKNYLEDEIALQQYLGNKYLSLHKDNVPLTRNNVTTDESASNLRIDNFGVPNNRREIRIQIVISPVTRNDSGQYGCLVLDENNMELDISYQIRDEDRRLSVIYFPTHAFPECSPPIVRVPLGSQVTLSCISEQANPPVDLRWNSQNEAMNQSAHRAEVQSDKNGFVTSELTLSTTLSDINDMYTCTIYSERFLNKIQTCSISVKTIWPVSLLVYPDESFVNIGSSLQFSCSASYATRGGPNAKIEWNMEPPITDASRVAINGNVLQITDIQAVDDATLIYCYALFEDQWFQSAPAKVFVNDLAMVTLPSQRNSTSTLSRTTESQSGWIVVFALTVLLCAIFAIVIIFLFLKLKKIQSGDKMPVSSVATANNGKDESNYAGLQQSDMKQQEYTELQIVLSPNVDENITKTTDNLEEQEYDYAYTETHPTDDVTSEQHTYGNV